MSTVEQTRHTGPFTWDDLADVANDGLRREIIGGTLIVNPSPIGRHQLAAQRLLKLLEATMPSDLVAIIAPFDWRYDETNYVEPDLVVCRSQDFDLDGWLLHPAVPVLLVEVLSRSNTGYDRLLKRDLYEQLGVAHFWLIDPGAPDREPSIVALQLDDDGRYQTVADVAGDNECSLEQPFPISITPSALLRR